MKKLFLSACLILFAPAPYAAAQSAPDAPQYQPGSTNAPSASGVPSGTTTGTAINGNTQATIPTGQDTYIYLQNNSQAPTPAQPQGSTGGTVGVGTTFP
ncbi:hypothetical protein EV132_1033 [Rhizobium sullae]|uniref:Uncharacterized protein n=1 Tax=Rhizobium sullae TaxID=50338 RepID=A0A4R3QB99_RHISU|nr:hypothetical protein EV132_1033 [Rhizobium sullae]